jgi:subtilisin family serine protease
MRYFDCLPHSPSKKPVRRASLLVELLEDRTLLSATIDPEISLLAVPNDTRLNDLYGMTKIQASAAWDTTTGSKSIVVADIDTGIDYTHPDLYKNIWIN